MFEFSAVDFYGLWPVFSFGIAFEQYVWCVMCVCMRHHYIYYYIYLTKNLFRLSMVSSLLMHCSNTDRQLETHTHIRVPQVKIGEKNPKY